MVRKRIWPFLKAKEKWSKSLKQEKPHAQKIDLHAFRIILYLQKLFGLILFFGSPWSMVWNSNSPPKCKHLVRSYCDIANASRNSSLKPPSKKHWTIDYRGRWIGNKAIKCKLSNRHFRWHHAASAIIRWLLLVVFSEKPWCHW